MLSFEGLCLGLSTLNPKFGFGAPLTTLNRNPYWGLVQGLKV